MDGYDTFEVLFFVIAITVYHIFFLVYLIKFPDRVSLSMNIAERQRWVRRYLFMKGAELTVVHSFRNMILGTTFLSNSSLLIAWGLLRPLLKIEDPLSAAPRTLLVVALFFIAFISFAMAVRFYTHLTFILTSFGEVEDVHCHNLQSSLTSMMSRATIFFWLGMRCFYFALPMGLWSFGFPGLLIGSILLIALLFLNDIYSQ